MTRKSKSKKKRRTEVSEEDIDVEDFLLIKYLLNHDKCGGVLNGLFWIRVFKRSELSVGSLLPRTMRGKLNAILDPLIPGNCYCTNSTALIRSYHMNIVWYYNSF